MPGLSVGSVLERLLCGGSFPDVTHRCLILIHPEPNSIPDGVLDAIAFVRPWAPETRDVDDRRQADARRIRAPWPTTPNRGRTGSRARLPTASERKIMPLLAKR